MRRLVLFALAAAGARLYYSGLRSAVGAAVRCEAATQSAYRGARRCESATDDMHVALVDMDAAYAKARKHFEDMLVETSGGWAA